MDNCVPKSAAAPPLRGAVVITGAGRGFGAALAAAFAEGLAPHDVAFVLLGGRDAGALAETARAVAAPGGGGGARAVTCHACDLGDPAALAGAWRAAVDGERSLAGDRPLDFAWLVHNAGSLGPLGVVGDLALAAAPGGGEGCGEGGGAQSPLGALVAAVQLGVTSAVVLSSLFLGWARARVALPPTPAPAGRLPACAVVNVSSLAAVQPLPSMGVYSAIKAARDMLGAVIAAEGAGGGGGGEHPGRRLPVAVLSYAPGPMDTAMAAELRGHPALDAGLRASFAGMAEARTYVDVRASAAKCFRVLAANRFRSGAHVDFYDPDPAGPVDDEAPAAAVAAS
jgi:sepiapterin reductase